MDVLNIIKQLAEKATSKNRGGFMQGRGRGRGRRRGGATKNFNGQRQYNEQYQQNYPAQQHQDDRQYYDEQLNQYHRQQQQQQPPSPPPQFHQQQEQQQFESNDHVHHNLYSEEQRFYEDVYDEPGNFNNQESNQISPSMSNFELNHHQSNFQNAQEHHGHQSNWMKQNFSAKSQTSQRNNKNPFKMGNTSSPQNRAAKRIRSTSGSPRLTATTTKKSIQQTKILKKAPANKNKMTTKRNQYDAPQPMSIEKIPNSWPTQPEIVDNLNRSTSERLDKAYHPIKGGSADQPDCDGIKIEIVDESIETKQIAEDKMYLLETALMLALDKTITDKIYSKKHPQFIWSGLVDGILMVTCLNRTTVEWLEATLTSISQYVWPGASLRLLDTSFTQKLKKVTVWISGIIDEPAMVLYRIKKQNTDLQTQRWRIYHIEKKEPDGQLLFLGIDPSSLGALEARDLKAFYGFRRIVFELSNVKENSICDLTDPNDDTNTIVIS